MSPCPQVSPLCLRCFGWKDLPEVDGLWTDLRVPELLELGAWWGRDIGLCGGLNAPSLRNRSGGLTESVEEAEAGAGGHDGGRDPCIMS